MPLPIRDGNQSLTTLSTILVSNAHIPAHTVVSLGTQAITDIATAVSGVELGPNTINALENITVTLGQVTVTGGLTDAQLRASAVTIAGTVDANLITSSVYDSGNDSLKVSINDVGGSAIGTSVPISGTVTATISGTASVTFSQASVTFGTAVVTGSASILNFPATQTVTFSQAPVTFGTAVITGSTSILNFPATQTVSFGLVSGTVTVGNSITINSLPSISGVVQVLDVNAVLDGDGNIFGLDRDFPISGSVTIGAGTAQIGSVTASISGTPSVTFGLISGTVTANNFTLTNALQYDGSHYFLKVGGVATTGGTSFPVYVAGSVTVGNSVTVGSLPAISGTVTANGLSIGGTVANVFPIGVDTLYSGVRTVTDLVGYRLPISLGDSNTVVTIANIQGTSVTTSNFTSLTPSTVLAGFNATREVLTIFNEGAGNLHISVGTTCTTQAYQVRLSTGDYYEAPLNQASITHSAVFATAGTARVTQVS